MENVDSEDNQGLGVCIPSEKIELSRIMNADHRPIWLLNKIEWFQFERILEHTGFNEKGNNILFHSLLKLSHMFSIKIGRKVVAMLK